MKSPSINELTRGGFNKYELVIVTAKSARMVTDYYVIQREYADRKTAQKEFSASSEGINDDLRNKKAVKIAIDGIKSGKFKRACDVTESDLEEEPEDADIPAEETEEIPSEAEEAEVLEQTAE